MNAALLCSSSRVAGPGCRFHGNWTIPPPEDSTTRPSFYDLRALAAERARAGLRYQEFLRVPALSAGIYVLPSGAKDMQTPHKEDELYYVVSGRARMRVRAEEREVGPGSLIFVEAEAEHGFFDISEQLEVLVFFAPAESR
ncbi:MAG TPA: cupin domain-containing protein [Terriglobales bacterium]|nr:cupin domain-containing protein [Terriglobales bacterium]